MLTTPTQPFDFANPPGDPQELATAMMQVMNDYKAVGISANQLGIPFSVFVLRGYPTNFVCFNPKIVFYSPELEVEEEGCLSFPAMFMKVERPKSVYAEFTDENGQVHQEWFDGLTARCFLHETDHMNGIKYTKYVGPVALKMAKQKQLKKIKTVKRKLKNAV